MTISKVTFKMIRDDALFEFLLGLGECSGVYLKYDDYDKYMSTFDIFTNDRLLDKRVEKKLNDLGVIDGGCMFLRVEYETT